MSIPPEYLAVLVCVGLTLVLAFSIRLDLNVIAARIATVSRMEAKLDLLLKQANIKYDPYKNVSPLVVDAVRRGKKIEAIKCYRNESGVGLKEAKEFIEEVQRRVGVS